MILDKLHMFAFAVENSQIFMLNKIGFEKRGKFGYDLSFPSWSFLEENLYVCLNNKRM